jgi:hypothetical protein
MLVVLGVSNFYCTRNFKKIESSTGKAVAAKVNGAGMVFVTETIDYGTVAHNSDGKREFVFTNNGNKPLIITNAQGSCGCTVPTYQKSQLLQVQKELLSKI